MMRTNTASSMQKTYDDCYLICSTAIYFEGQVSRSVDEEKEAPQHNRTTDLENVAGQRS